MSHHATALTVFIILFGFVTVLGFAAARWRRAESLASLDEWGLGGRGFGTFVTWFLLGGDLYTAYTFVAVPGAMYATGAVTGWFAVPYTILVYPLVFVFLPRLWSVAHRHGYVTPADFIRGRYDSRALATAVAITGLVATMPYIALQLVGIQAVLEVLGVGGTSNAFLKDLPLFIAFAILAAYTYSSGLRAPALIAFVKDALIYIVIIVAVIYIPIKLGGYAKIFDAAQAKLTSPPAVKAKATFIPGPKAYFAYGSLALGSAMALFMYPHSITAVLATKDRNVVRRNAALLPAYSFLLGLIALLGFMAIADGIKTKNSRLAVPLLFDHRFPGWFAGVAFAAIAIGALVPAAIM
jgi:SSS family solute:Na+ symporter